jgi:DNA-binding SARP family transcriptional activator
MANQGRSQTLRDWIESVPENIFTSIPWLIFWKGNCLIPFDPSKSIQLFKQAFEKFKENGDAIGILLSWCAAVDVSLHAGEFRFLDSWISQIEYVLQSGAADPAKEIDEHFTMSMFIAFSFGRLAHPDMQLCSERAFSLFQSTSDPNVCLQTGVYLVVHDLWKGDNARASIVIDVLLQMARSKKTSDLVTILINATETLYLLFTAACDASVKKVLDTLDFADQTGVHIWDAHLLCNGLAAALSTGNLNQIEILNKRLEACLPNAKRFDLCYKYILSSWNYIIQNRLDLAYQNAELAAGMIPEIGFEPAEPAPHIAKALFLQKLGKNEESAHSFSEAWTIISRIKSYQLEFMYSLFRSKSEFDLKNDKEAMQLLHRAMSLGKQYKLYNSYWWHGAMMSELSVRALEANIETDYVQELIRKRNLIPENPPIHVENWPWPVKIKTLGRFEIYVEGEALVFSGKAQKKPMEMLKAIISLGGKDIPEEQLEDLLWPDSDGDAAHNAFTTTLSRLRNILGRSEAIQMSDGKVTLDPRLCWMDVWAFVHSIKQFESALRSQSSSSVHAILDRIFDLYQGGFLPADTHVAWTTSIRERLRSQFLRVLGEAANSGERARQWSEATELCRRFLEIDHLSEEIYQRLIRCQIQLGLHAEAIAAYNQCEKALREAFGISPSEKTKSLHRSILAAK